MKGLVGTLLFLAAILNVQGQLIEDSIVSLNVRIEQIEQEKQQVQQNIEALKLLKIRRDLDAIGLPKSIGDSTPVVWHAAMALVYSNAHKQATWVAHIITPDVLTGTVFRSNDFRIDTCVQGGSAVENDYFLKYMQPDSSYKYDGFGFDRGHLAPSADFRWSEKALSESYYYSNMSPQSPELNRGAWAAVEDKVRGYIYENPFRQLYVVTGPALKSDLPKIERGANKVSIPEYFWKVVADPMAEKGIGFILPNRLVNEPIEHFAVSIDSVERFTGLDFFGKLPDHKQKVVENQRVLKDWFPAFAKGDVEPVSVINLQSGQINTVIARQWINSSKPITVIGTVVGTSLSRAGNVLINVDKQFPNQVFTIFIKKEFLQNFTFDPIEYLKGKQIEVRGKIVGLDGLPAMFVEDGDAIKVKTPVLYY